ncbi:MAG: hypothetical protein AAF830_00045 [Pseudomonadota bacterium]
MLTVLNVILVVVAATMMLVDDRMLDGANVWLKPLKFSISFLTYYAALSFFAAWMAPGAKRLTGHRIAVGIVTLGFVYEVAWLFTCAALGVRSHFNYDSALFSTLYIFAGIGAMMLVLGPLAMGVSVLRAKYSAPNPAMATAIGWGLVLVFILSPMVAYFLSAGMVNFGGSLNGYGEGIFGWRMEKGDMRAAHFLATHALHIVPFLAFLPTRAFKGEIGIWLSRLIAAAFSAATLWLAWTVIQRADLPEIFRSPF